MLLLKNYLVLISYIMLETIRIIGDSDNRRLDDWRSTVLDFYCQSFYFWPYSHLFLLVFSLPN
jgi:hypothetical protein